MTELNLPKDCLKSLGIHWYTHQDILQVSIPDVAEINALTKRKLVSSIAQIYDIMGWFVPVIPYAKILLQQMWESNTDWDEAVPAQILEC